MRTSLFSVVLTIWASLASAQPVKVFIFAGQSNAQGYGRTIQLAPVPTWAQTAANGWTGAPTVSSDTGFGYSHPTLAQSVRYANNNSTTTIPVGWGRFVGERQTTAGVFGEMDQYGPEMSFVQRYRADHPTDQIAVLKIVLGGSSIEDWLTGAMRPVWEQMIDGAKTWDTSITLEWAGLIWWQGESGAANAYAYEHPTLGAEYSDKLRTLLSLMRARTSLTLPVVVARIGDHMLADNIILPMVQPATDQWHPGVTAEQLRAATEYRRSQQVFVGGDPGNVWVDTDRLPVLQLNAPAWWYHHTGAGYLAAGERLYAAFAAALPPPPPLPPVRVTFNGVDAPWTVTLNGSPVGGNGDVIAVVE